MEDYGAVLRSMNNIPSLGIEVGDDLVFHLMDDCPHFVVVRDGLANHELGYNQRDELQRHAESFVILWSRPPSSADYLRLACSFLAPPAKTEGVLRLLA